MTNTKNIEIFFYTKNEVTEFSKFIVSESLKKMPFAKLSVFLKSDFQEGEPVKCENIIGVNILLEVDN